MEFDQALNKRRSTRAFQKKEIEEEKLKSILEAVNRAPSAGNLQAYEIVLVRDEKTKENIAQAALSQDFLSKAPVLLIFFAHPKKSATKYGERGEKIYSLQDATIAAAYAQLAAVNQGLACAWVGAFDNEELKNILMTPSDLEPIAVIPIGYAAERPKVSGRRDLNDIVHQERF